MLNVTNPGTWSMLASVALLAGAVALPGAAIAGECPADKVGVDVTKPGATEPSGLEDKVLASIDLGQEMLAANDRNLRLRRLELQPGGVVPWHSHGDRPAIIYVIKGSVTEYSSTCAVPIVHHAGEVTPEMHGTSHWWKNTGKSVAVLLSADILHDKADSHTM